MKLWKPAFDRGKVTEGPGACVALVREGQVILPPITSGILESINLPGLSSPIIGDGEALVDGGLVNKLLLNLGLEKVNFYRSPQYWPFIMATVNLWKGVGFGSITYLTGILGMASLGLMETDPTVDAAELEIDHLCLNLLALRQPAGSDLRFVTTALKIVTDLELEPDARSKLNM